jgi:hypothetical protein
MNLCGWKPPLFTDALGLALRLGAATLVSVVGAPGVALAQVQDDPVPGKPAPTTQPRFGGAGQWVMLGTSNDLYAFKETFSRGDAKLMTVGVSVGVDRFVVRHFSVGLDAGVGYADNQGYGVDTFGETKSTSFTGGLRLGYDVPLGQRFSWYPRLTLGIASAHSETTVLAGGDGSSTSAVASSIGPTVNLYAPLLLHLVPHVFMGFGPRVRHDFGVQRGGPYEGTQSTLVSGDLVLGGWWGERGASVDSAANAVEPDDAPFGSRGQLVLGLATDASVSYRTDSASKYSEMAADLIPSLDYFVLDNLSIGVDAFISHASGTSLDVGETPTDFAFTTVGLGPRVGSNVPITKSSHLWPQVELGYGTVFTSLSSRDGTNQHSSKRSWLRLSAPILFKVTSHFLLGAGPYFFHEISNTDQYGNENEAESVGARLLMAGWFDVLR